MSVVVFVSPCQTVVLQKALSNHYRIIPAECWGVLEAVIRSEPVCAVILDPTRDECGDVMQTERLIKKYSSLPFIAYVGVNAHSVKAVARLARVGLQDVFLFAHDDSPEYIKERVDAVSASALASVFLGELRPFLKPLPPSTAAAVEDLFEMPYRYSGAHDLAKAAHFPATRL